MEILRKTTGFKSLEKYQEKIYDKFCFGKVTGP